MTAIPSTPEELRVGDLVFRAFRDSDSDRLREAFEDPLLKQWNGGPTDPVGLAEWIARRSDWTLGDHASWVVSDDTDDVLGSVSLFHIDLDQRDGEMGYWVSPWVQRRGIGLASVCAAVDYAFTRIGLRRVYLYHAVPNTASCALALRAGFVQEGHLRQSHRYADGVWHDEHLHGRLVTDSIDG